jgi:amino acid transporter
MLQDIWQFLVGLAICVVGLIILYLDFTSNAANPTVVNSGSHFFELGVGLALGGGIWAVIQVRQALGLAKPEETGEKPPQT